MAFSEILPYKIKRLFPLVALSIAPIFASCDKPDPAPTPVETRYDVELFFIPMWLDEITIENVQRHIDNPDVRHIYLIPGESVNWPRYTAGNIPSFRRTLESRLALSPRVRGRGDFPFKPGESSKVPEDSLWYIQNGWTINKYLEKQK